MKAIILTLIPYLIFAQSELLIPMDDDVFAPSDISGLTLWFDASTVTGVTSGEALSQWDDLSGNDNHATQGTGADQPLWVDNVVNTHAVVRAVSNDFLTLTSAIASAVVDNYTSFVVMKQRTSGTVMIALGTNAVGGSPYSLFDLGDGSVYAGNSAGFAFTATGGNNNAFTLFTTKSDNNTLSLRIDGVDKVLETVAGANSNTLLYIFRRGGDYSDGDIAELLFYDRPLTADEITLIESYLNTKYGL